MFFWCIRKRWRKQKIRKKNWTCEKKRNKDCCAFSMFRKLKLWYWLMIWYFFVFIQNKWSAFLSTALFIAHFDKYNTDSVEFLMFSIDSKFNDLWLKMIKIWIVCKNLSFIRSLTNVCSILLKSKISNVSFKKRIWRIEISLILLWNYQRLWITYARKKILRSNFPDSQWCRRIIANRLIDAITCHGTVQIKWKKRSFLFLEKEALNYRYSTILFLWKKAFFSSFFFLCFSWEAHGVSSQI